MIDYSLLFQNNLDSIDIGGTYELPSTYYENSDVLGLSPVQVTGNISLDDEGYEKINCVIKGDLYLADSISLEKVTYPYEIEYNDQIEENCKNGENLLDIFLFLWENILLEVPLQFTKVEDLSKFHGDGWKLISEEEHNSSNNPFSELLKDYEEE